jgi:hypothetical protein
MSEPADGMRVSLQKLVASERHAVQSDHRDGMRESLTKRVSLLKLRASERQAVQSVQRDGMRESLTKLVASAGPKKPWLRW